MKNYKSITIIAAFLLIIIAAMNLVTFLNESNKRNEIDRQAQFQYYLHINSEPYKQSLKQDTLFAERLDSIDKEVNKMNVKKP